MLLLLMKDYNPEIKKILLKNEKSTEKKASAMKAKKINKKNDSA